MRRCCLLRSLLVVGKSWRSRRLGTTASLLAALLVAAPTSRPAAGHPANNKYAVVSAMLGIMCACLRLGLVISVSLASFASAASPSKSLEDLEKEPSFWYESAQEAISKTLRRQRNEGVARNVIFFLGDGMSIPTLVASRIFKGQLAGRRGEEEFLEFEKFPYAGLLKTYNVDRQVPDSAGTATAFLCGVKGNYETIGLSAKAKWRECATAENAKVDSIMTWAQRAGKHTGVVTTTRITHATPAGAYAHTVHRDWESDSVIPSGTPCKDIARQLVEDEPGKNLNVIMGGGMEKFLPTNSILPDNKSGNRTDNMNLIEAWLEDKKNKRKDVGYKHVTNVDDLASVDVAKTDFLLGLFSSGHMNYESQKQNTKEPTLAQMTAKAVKILKRNPKGFVLLVEGGRIDHAHHDGIARLALEETLAMEKAIIAAMQLVDLDETLVLVTADHAHVMTVNGYPHRGNDILGLVNEVSNIDQLPYTTLMYTNGPGFNYPTDGQRLNITGTNTTHTAYKQLAAVPLDQETHGGDDVAVFAQGPMAHLFQSLQDQTYVAHVIAYAACIGPNADNCQLHRSTRFESSGNVATTATSSVSALVFSILLLTTLRLHFYS